jgi:hypothetical protein
MINIHNKYLSVDGFKMVQTGDMSGKPVYEFSALASIAGAN